MNCPVCGMENEAGTKFCTNCGTSLQSSNGSDLIGNAAEEISGETAGYTPVETKPAETVPVGYVNTAAAGAAAHGAAKPDSNEVKLPKAKRDMSPCKPLSTWSFVWRTLLYCIPVIGLVLMFVFAFSKNINENSKSHARASLIFVLIAAIIAIAGAVLFFIFRDQIVYWIESTGIQLP